MSELHLSWQFWFGLAYGIGLTFIGKWYRDRYREWRGDM